MSAATMSPAEAKTAIYNATVELLRLNEKVGNGLPTEIVQCINGQPNVSSNRIMQGGGRRRSGGAPTRRHRSQARRKTQNQRHK